MPFTPEALEFLFENRLMDSKAWYQENKARFKQLVEEPMLELSRKLAPTVLAIDPAIVAEPRRTVSRVWRDTRFTKDKTLFRDVMWLVFRRGKGMAYPAFYIEFGPGLLRCGCGYYNTPPQVAALLREWIIRDDRRFLAATQALAKAEGCTLHGDRYKRDRYESYPEEKRQWLSLKSFVAGWSSLEPELFFSDDLGDRMAEGFRQLAPVYHFLLDAHLQAAEMPEQL